jgi:methenyltetrahydromethanopterin cyclohydrolase
MTYNHVMPTLNERAWELCDAMAADAEQLGIAVTTLPCGTRIIDCGVKAAGSIEAGRRLAEICMSGMGTVQIIPESDGLSYPKWPDPACLFPGLKTKFVHVSTEQPVAACMASQYAGWQITGDDFFAMGSGPMRAAACREDIFQSIGNCEKPNVCVGVLETSKIPKDEVCVDLSKKCSIKPESLTLLIARTSSLAGTVQIVARSVETALHKLHVLGFDIGHVQSGRGTAPLPPVAKDDLTAIGWTNDAILYGGMVTLFVTADEATIEEFGPRVPSCASRDFGRPFAEIFTRYDNDFYRIDPMLFSPAEVNFVPLNTEHALERLCGGIAPDILIQSFAQNK